MSQEYTEDKVVTLKKLTGCQRLFEVFLLVTAIFAVYLMVALLSFDPADPSWSQTAWHEPIHNTGGRLGAWIADVLLFIYGVVAYLLPPTILALCWSSFRSRYNRRQTDYFMLALRIIGFVALVLSTCTLAAMNLDDWYHFASGGVLGSLLNSALLPAVSHVGATLILLAVWAAGLTLFTGWSWLIIVEKIGWVTMSILTIVMNRFRSTERDNSDNTRPSSDGDLEPTFTADDVLFSAANPVNPLAEHPSDDADAPNDFYNENQLDLPLSPVSNLKHDLKVLEEQQPAVYKTADGAEIPSGSTAGDSPITQLAATQLASTQAIIEDTNLQSTLDHEHTDVTSFLPNTDRQSPMNDAFVAHPTNSSLTPAFSHSSFSSVEIFSDTDDNDTPVMESESTANAFTPTHFVPADRFDEGAAGEPISAAIPSTLISTTATTTTITTAATASTAASSAMVTKPRAIPELPRPNPVRIPTRRELMSYGITLPSQREAEAKEREEKQRLAELAAENCGDEELSDALQQEVLRQEFAEQQQARYGQLYEDDDTDALNDDSGDSEQWAYSQPVVSTNRVSNIAEVERETSTLINQVEVTPSVSVVTQPQQPIVAEPSVGVESKNEMYDQLATGNEPEYAPESSRVRIPAEQGEASSASSFSNPDMDSLIHPFLMRNDKPLHKPTTPLPTLDLLTPPPASKEPVNMAALEQLGQLVEDRLADYRVKARVVGILPGPVITLFELDLAPGVKAARISNLSRDLARSLSAVAVRVVEVIPGRPYVGLELPNKHRQTVYLREVLDCAKFRDMVSPLAIVLGQDISGQPVVADLGKMPHVLVAGTTGSGKSVGVNAMIISMLYKATPDEVRFIMIDPKMLELSVYEGIPHLLTEVVTDMKDAANALRWCVGEMERRYKLMSALGVRNLAGYNERIQQANDMGRPIPNPFWKPTDGMDLTAPVLEKLPYIVVIVDEFADLMMAVGKKVEELIARLAQKARAAGIHLVLATQRPSVDVITGLIKANIPTRIAFTVSSKIDSRTILDQGGAESLLGMGDMLYLAPNSSTPVRVHGAFVRDEEVHAVVQDWKARGKPQYVDSIIKAPEESENGFSLDGDEELDPLYDQAVAFVVEKRKASISGVQRQFRIGYNRAARIIEQMEAQGTVSAPGHNGNREVLAPPPYE